MSAALEYDAMVRELCAIGVPRDKAEQQAKRELRIVVETSPVAKQSAAPLALPFRITIPWSVLVSDNDRKEPVVRRSANGAVRAAMRLTLRYKTGQAQIRQAAKTLVGDAAPVACPLLLIARVYRPPSRRNDSINFAKIVGDALEGVVYENDGQLCRSTWIKAETDIDAPRCEIEISKL